MIFDPPLVEARLVDRPNRFLARVQLAGRLLSAHVHDPGRLTELMVRGAPVCLRKAAPGRKTTHDLILVKRGRVWVSVYSTLPNRLVGEALSAGRLLELGRHASFRREVRSGTSRVDFLLHQDTPHWLEVKSATLVEGRTARFPDAPTLRGVRHLHHLIERRMAGEAASMLFVVQRADADEIRPHESRDPVFAGALRAARAAGVGLFARRCRVSPRGISLASAIPVRV